MVKRTCSTGDSRQMQAGEVVLELEPGGGDLKDETAKPTILDVDDL